LRSKLSSVIKLVSFVSSTISSSCSIDSLIFASEGSAVPVTVGTEAAVFDATAVFVFVVDLFSDTVVAFAVVLAAAVFVLLPVAASSSVFVQAANIPIRHLHNSYCRDTII